METSWLEDFLTLAEEGNFSRAAEQRNASQPAFSRRIKGLETWVGTELFDRGTHRLALTEAGHAFKNVAEDLLRRLALGREQARDIGNSAGAVLRIASTHVLSTTFFPDWLRMLGTKGDLGSMSLVADNMAACERLMLAGAADFLLCHDHPAAGNRLDPGNFQSVLLGADNLVPVCVPTPKGAPAFALPGTDEDPLPHLAFDEGSGMGQILARAGVIAARGARLQPVFRSHLAMALLRMARDGEGVAWAPHSLCGRDMEAGRLVRAGDETFDVPLEIRLYRPRARRSPSSEAFWARVRQTAADGGGDAQRPS